jgi:hypothetical protein
MAFIAACLGLMAGLLFASDTSQDRTDQVALAHVSPNPLMQLPGMRPAQLPAVGATRAAVLPREIISEVSNAPNPFDSRKGGLEGHTQISYRLSADYSVRVTLYDLLGFRVRRWEFSPGQDGGKAGTNHFLWDGTNEAGKKVSKGGYLAQIEVEAGSTVATALRKIAVIH